MSEIVPFAVSQKSSCRASMKELSASRKGSKGPFVFGGTSKERSRAERDFVQLRIGLLTGGGDKHYSIGLTSALTSAGAYVEFVGSDALVSPVLDRNPRVVFLNLRGDQNSNATFIVKTRRIIVYYLKLLRFVAKTRAPLLHILWDNKWDAFDRTVLLLFYKGCGKRVAFTAHNVNAARRDSVDNWMNRATLRIQYRLVDHIFVHTEKMRQELAAEFRIGRSKITLIPYGLNNVIDDTGLTTQDAKRRLVRSEAGKTMLCFGQIAPYKGMEYVLGALRMLTQVHNDYHLIIAGKPKWDDRYWSRMVKLIAEFGIQQYVTQKIQFIPDDETECYFKAADVLVLPYTHIFQSGVLSLGYSFGLPVIASDVGSLREEIIEGQTGFVCAPKDSESLASTIEKYFASELYRDLEQRRHEIKAYARERYSWEKVAEITTGVYRRLLSPEEA